MRLTWRLSSGIWTTVTRSFICIAAGIIERKNFNKKSSDLECDARPKASDVLAGKCACNQPGF